MRPWTVLARWLRGRNRMVEKPPTRAAKYVVTIECHQCLKRDEYAVVSHRHPPFQVGHEEYGEHYCDCSNSEHTVVGVEPLDELAEDTLN